MPTQILWLPREGFTADTIQVALRKTLFNPALTLPVLLLSRYTSKGKDLALRHAKLSKWLKVFTYIGIARFLNRSLNRKSLDNWENHQWDWKKELVVITGGSDGFGKEMVILLGVRNIKVVILDIQPPTFDLPNDNVKYVKCDLTSPEAISNTAKHIQTTYGHPTILINNAGLANGTTILSTSDDALNRVFAVNILAHFRLIREFLPHMISLNHGMVVTLASMSAYVAPPQLVDYACTKAAALSFHEGLAMELKTRYAAPRVRTLCICPSWAKTKLSEGFENKSPFFSPMLSPQTVAEVAVEEILAGRSGVTILPRVHEWLGSCVRSFPWWLQQKIREGTKDAVRDHMAIASVVDG